MLDLYCLMQSSKRGALSQATHTIFIALNSNIMKQLHHMPGVDWGPFNEKQSKISLDIDRDNRKFYTP